MAFKDISSWFIQSYATCWANGEWLNNWANAGLCTFETETAFMNSWLYHCSFKQPKWYLNWSASSYLIFMIFFTEPQFEAKKVVLRQNSLWRFTRFFPVPIGNYYTWLILFTQQAVVMVLTNIRCVRWAGFHNLVWTLVYLISFNQFNVIDISLSQPSINPDEILTIEFHLYSMFSSRNHLIIIIKCCTPCTMIYRSNQNLIFKQTFIFPTQPISMLSAGNNLIPIIICCTSCTMKYRSKQKSTFKLTYISSHPTLNPKKRLRPSIFSATLT